MLPIGWRRRRVPPGAATLGEIAGEVTTEDLLGRNFADFCISERLRCC
jgi:tRNA U34 5-carboxymethylaminomethyl modifying GTPase MnmE/TrmE